MSERVLGVKHKITTILGQNSCVITLELDTRNACVHFQLASQMPASHRHRKTNTPKRLSATKPMNMTSPV